MFKCRIGLGLGLIECAFGTISGRLGGLSFLCGGVFGFGLLKLLCRSFQGFLHARKVFGALAVGGQLFTHRVELFLQLSDALAQGLLTGGPGVELSLPGLDRSLGFFVLGNVF